MKTILTIFVLLFCGLWYYLQQPVGKDEIYVNRLVYLKSDSSLFTGTLKVVGKASYWNVSFCKGFPCDGWAEHQNGGSYVSKGKYLLVNETLSESSLQMLSNDTVIINYWQEGGDIPSDPYHFTVLILKDVAFFQSDKKQHDNYIYQLANAVMKDNLKLKYDYIKISFVNAVHDWSNDYSKEYKVKSGKLLEILQE